MSTTPPAPEAGGVRASPALAAPVSFLEAFRFWLKLGFISFGGPAGQISIMHQELVERRRWISEHRFLHALNYTMVLPGPEAQQLATYIGWLMHGTSGGIVAGALFVLPSLIILIALSWIYMAFHTTPLVAGIFYGMKPAVTAIVTFAAWRIGSRTLKNHVLRAIAAAALVVMLFFNLPFPVIVLTAGIIGLVGSRLRPSLFEIQPGHQAATQQYGRALIDDDTPIPPHAAFNVRSLAIHAVVGLAIWTVAISGLSALWGWDATLTNMGWFFTKAALLTFGGAYAVLPYVYQGAVDHYQWLSAPQMIDGLALGETTPGPLIMVVAFVGFVGGWTRELFGADVPALAGVAGACVATFFTFLPSFVFILVGGPAVEATRHEIRFSAPLAAIGAAIVGVILNLAVFFAIHVFWPGGLQGPFEWFAAVICLCAIVALFRFRVGIMPVIAVSALAGLAFAQFAK